MGTHAYLILAHKNPEQVKKLLGMLDHPENEIYVHIDRKANFGYVDLEGACKLSDLHFINPRRRVTWGGVSIIRVEMDLLEEAVKKPHFYYHLISGMDLPIKSQDFIHTFFEENRGKEFLDLWKIPDHTLRRVRYYTLFPEGSRFFLTNWLNHGFKGLMRFLGISMNDGVEFKQGSQWFSITHECAVYTVSRREWVEKVFRHSSMPDEIFIPTIFFDSPFKDRLFCDAETENHDISRSNMRFIDWNNSGSIRHPRTFTIADAALLDSVPHLWARKFDETVDSEIIDYYSNKFSQFR